MNAERLLGVYERIAEAPDAVARLRQFILDLAVRGKLVYQDPADEPAQELLQLIEREKLELVRAGALKKQKPLPLLTEPPFELPHNWCWTRIREVTSDRGQKVPNSRFTYIDVSSINKELGVVSAPAVLEPVGAPSRARKVAIKGDVIYSCVRPYLLNVAILDEDFEPAPIVSTAFAVLNGHGLVLSRYIWIVLRSPFTVQCVEEVQRGQAYPAINDTDFALLPFPLPPLAEQRRIVAKVDELMALCDQMEAARTAREAKRDQLTAASLGRLNAPNSDIFQADAGFVLDALPALTRRPEQVKALRQTILNLAVRGKLVPQDPADESVLRYLRREFTPSLQPLELGLVLPTTWAWLKLGDLIGGMDAGWSPQCEDRPREDDSQWAILKTTAVQALSFNPFQNKLLPKNLAPRPQHQVQVGDILVTRAGPKARVGVSCVVENPHPRLMISDKIVRLHLLGDLTPRYVALALNAGHTLDFLEAAKSGMAVMQMNISQEKLRSAPVPLPPIAAQCRIVAKVEELMILCDQLEASLVSADEARRRLLEATLEEALESRIPLPA